VHLLSTTDREEAAVDCLRLLYAGLPAGNSALTVFNSRDSRGRNALHTAAEGGRILLLRSLVSTLGSAGLLEEDNNGVTPFDILYKALAASSSGPELNVMREHPAAKPVQRAALRTKDELQSVISHLEGKLSQADLRSLARRRGTATGSVTVADTTDASATSSGPLQSSDVAPVPASSLGQPADKSGTTSLIPNTDPWREADVAEDETYVYCDEIDTADSTPSGSGLVTSSEPFRAELRVGDLSMAGVSAEMPLEHPSLLASRSSSLGLDLQPAGIHLPPDALRLSRQR
jgi:hypothetical protein